jgi:hypothetical protein
MERGQAACQRLARPAQLLQAGRHLVVAQAAIVAARPADDLIPARVAAGTMAVDHAGRLRPQNRGVVPGGAVTAGHGAIVHRGRQARVGGEMKPERLTGYVTPNLREHALKPRTPPGRLVPPYDTTNRQPAAGAGQSSANGTIPRHRSRPCGYPSGYPGFLSGVRPDPAAGDGDRLTNSLRELWGYLLVPGGCAFAAERHNDLICAAAAISRSRSLKVPNGGYA